MVNSRIRQLDETFFALSDPTRRQILLALRGHDLTVAELSQPFAISAPAISKHLRVLERAGLVQQRREGRTRKCQLAAEPLKKASQCVEQFRAFWENRLDKLAEYLEQPSNSEESHSPRTRSKNRKRKTK